MNARRLFAPALAAGFTVLLGLLAQPSCGSDHHLKAAKATDTFRVACQMPASAAAAPQSLLDTGCFAASGNQATSLYGYEVNGVLWSDNAQKQRWLFVPTGVPGSFDGNGILVLPASGGAIKTFSRDDRRLETRFIFKNAAGTYEAVTYAWNDAGTDATLVPDAGETITYDGNKTWEYFSRTNCLFCHNATAGTLLGPRLPQLQRTVIAADGNAVSQLADMVAKNVVAPGFDANVVAWPAPDSTAPLAARTRSYLATNCSFCHLPGGASTTQVDMRYDTPLSQMGACGVAPSFGNFAVANANVVFPGNPNASIMSFRVHSEVVGQKMPPVGHAVTDPNGAALIDAWITSLTGCTDG